MPRRSRVEGEATESCSQTSRDVCVLEGMELILSPPESQSREGAASLGPGTSNTAKKSQRSYRRMRITLPKERCFQPREAGVLFF